MVNLSGMFNKAKRAVRDNPDAVRGGLDKVEGLINSTTKGKYADKLTKGRDGIDKALGVPGETRDAYREEAGRQERTDPVSTQPVDAPEPIDTPAPIDDLTRGTRPGDTGTVPRQPGSGSTGSPGGTGGTGTGV